MARLTKGGKKAPEPVHMDERWAISYLDMMTVLFLTFVVLFSMSSIDAGKYDQLKNSLATGFGQEQTDFEDVSEGVITDKPGENEPAATMTEEEGGLTAEEKLSKIEADVSQKLKAIGEADAVEYEHVNGTLVIRIVSGGTLFEPDSSTVSGEGAKLLANITPSIKKYDGTVSVEGHADYRQSLNYETNWELSSDRAVKVGRHMIEDLKLPAASVQATGFGSTRPIEGNRDFLDRNRRVDIVVLTESDPGADEAAEAAIKEKIAEVESTENSSES